MKKFFKAKKREFAAMRKINRWFLKQKKVLMMLFLIVFGFSTFYFLGFNNVKVAQAAARTASVSGNWSDTATWGGQSVPVLGDTVTINDGINVTVDTVAACDSLTFTATNTSNAVTISGSNSLTITNALTLPSPNGASQTETVAVGAGALSAGSVSLGGVGSGRNTSLTISTGTVTVSGDITSAGAASRIIFSGAGTLNAGGTFMSGTRGTFTPATGTVNFNAAGAQAIAPFTYMFNNVTLSGSDIKTTTNATINGVLSMEGTATASAAPIYGVAATLKYNTATSRTVGAEWITPFVAGGGVVIANTGTITLNANKVINATSLLTVESGADLSMLTRSLTLYSDFINNGGTLSGTTGGVTITGTADQSIGAFSTMGTVSMTKTAGTATFVGNVNGAGLSINGIGGTLDLGAGLTHTFTSTWTRTNGTLNGGSSTIDFSKSSTVSSGSGVTFNAGTGTVKYSNAVAQTLPALTYNNLTLSGGGIKTFATTPTVNGVLSMEGTATVVVTGAPVVTYGPSATLQYNTSAVRTASSEEWISPFAGTGGVVFVNIGTLIIMDTAKVFNDDVPLTIISGAILATNNFQLTLGGNFVNSGGTFNAGSSNIIIGPGTAPQSIAGFTTTGGVTCNKSGGVATMTGNMNASSLINSTAGGTLNLGAGLTHTITGAWTRTDGILDGGSSILNIGGTVTNTAGTFTAGTSTVNYNGVGAQTTADVNYYNLTLSGSGAKTLGTSTTTISGNLTLSGTASATGAVGLSIGGDVTIGSGTAFTAGSFTHDVAGNWTNNGGTFTNTGSTINLNGSSAQIIGGSASTTFENLTINNPGGISASIDSAIDGVLDLTSVNPSASAGTLDLGSNILTMGGSATTVGAGDVTGIVKRTTLVTGTSYTFGNQYSTVNFQNVGTLPTDMSIRIAIGSAPAWKTDAITRTYEMIRTGGSGSFATLKVHYLDSELNGNTEDTLVKWAAVSPFTPGTGTEDGRSNYDDTNNWVGTASFDISLLPTSFGSREVTLADTAIAGVTWNGSISTDWMVACNWTSTPGSLCGVPTDLADVTIPDASTTPNDPILNPALAVRTLTLQSGAILNTAAGYASTVTISGASGAWSNNGGTFHANVDGTDPLGSTIIFTNPIATVSGTTDFYNVTINAGAGATMGSGSIMRIGGTMTNNGTWPAAGLTNATVEYNGGAQTILVPNGVTPGYDNLILSGTGVKTMPGPAFNIGGDFVISGTASAIANADITTGGNFTVGSGTSFTTGAFNDNVGGNFSNSGSFVTTGGTLTLDGTSSQAIGGSIDTTFNDLTINNSAGATLSSVSPTIDGVLTLTSGNITTGANTLIISPTGSVSRTSGHVVGNLQKDVATGLGVSRVFEIGTTNYNPVTITFGNVTVAGNLTAKATTGDHPNIASSTIDPAKTVNTYWTLTDGGITFDNYSAVFDFVVGDLDGGVNTANFLVGTYNAGWTYPTVGTKNPTNTQITGETSFSDFQLGELATIGSNATLSNFTISAGTLSPVFSSGTTSYTDSVANGTANVTVTPTATVAGATITVNGTPVVSGFASGSIALNVGLNTITILVTAQDAVTTKTYTIAVTRASAGGGGGGGGGGGYIPPAPASTLLSTGNYSANEALNLSTTINIDKGAIALPAGAISPCLSNSLIKLADDHNPLTQADSSVYYCSTDGRRYAFPNASIYFSWYPSFDNIQIISSQAMSAIPLGLNVTIKPGSRLVKFTTDPKVYAVAPGGALRWVADEATAVALYGSDWNKWVIDISDAFFTNYHFAGNITLDLVTSGSALPPASLLVISPATPAPTQCHSDTTFTQDLSLGSSGSQVLALQNLLKCLGYFPADIVANGNFGPATETAVKKFQTAKQLDPLGYVGSGTRAALNTY